MSEVPGSLRAAFAVLLAALLGGALLSGGGGEEGGGLLEDIGLADRSFGSSAVEPVPFDGRSPVVPSGQRERVLVELPRPALGALDDVGGMRPRARRAYVASLEDETEALLSALDARGVRTRDVVTYARTWHGFSATVDSADLPGLASLGARVRANRRLFPAVSEPVPLPGAASAPEVPSDAPRVALLAGGAPGGEGAYDATDGDDDPAPAEGEAGGVALVDELARLGVGARVLRVSALRQVGGLAGAEEFARTDELLDAFERTVDPDLDGDPSDHDAVALVGVNAPYAAFEDAPEVRAVAAAQRLGTLVVAPAGHEGPAAGAFGTVGAPGAAAEAVAVAPRSSPENAARASLTAGDVTIDAAALLGGAPPAGELPLSAPFIEEAGADLRGRVALVQADAAPAARAAAAAAAGAEAVVLAEPREDRVLAAMPAGRVPVPVLGVTGEAAEALLALEPGAPVRVGAVEAGPGEPSGDVALTASEGPAFGGAVKPDLARPGVTTAGGRLVAGAAVAAAAVAADAARLDEEDPVAAREALLEATDAVREAAGGDAEDPPEAPEVPVGELTVSEEGGRTGVSFTVGSFERGDPLAGEGTVIVPAATLELTLERAGGGLVERLTPQGGERGVLPGEYAYTLRRGLLRRLEDGEYRFRVRARAPRQAEPTVAASPEFAAP